MFTGASPSLSDLARAHPVHHRRHRGAYGRKGPPEHQGLLQKGGKRVAVTDIETGLVPGTTVANFIDTRCLSCLSDWGLNAQCASFLFDHIWPAQRLAGACQTHINPILI